MMITTSVTYFHVINKQQEKCLIGQKIKQACNNNIRVLNSIEISYTVNDDNYDDHHISFISLWFTYVFAVANFVSLNS
ncbi:hypothetical protein DERF_005729 [Dermatophagoides farinae]|uniref:Uncharacterized protein n=1 Tax=Dermatophagoides farinae TaxID=6954 RepID=A0A922L6W7_DERFA|nr:hypothetical protein DERF_005729 [Dermatophagoides farinae]